jgi:hypothetical protein
MHSVTRQRPNQQRPTGVVRLLQTAVIGGLCAACFGCGPQPTMLTGTVTLDGQPVEKAVVQFTPERRDARTAVALTDQAGRYSLPIAAVPFQVVISAQKVVGQKKDDANPAGPLIDVYADVLPARYADATRSNLRVEPIALQSTTVDFALTSAPPDAR